MTDIPQETKKLQELIKESGSVLITSHISPDGDSVSSSLLLYQLLRLNHPDKKVSVSMEERPYDLSFLSGYENIEFQPLIEALEKQKPDLLVILDANAIYRVARTPEKIEQYLGRHKTKLAVVDHHVGISITKFDVYINNSSSAVTLDIYDIFIEKLGYKKPPGYAQIALTGIYTDTGGFVHENLNPSSYEHVFEVIPKLLADGASIESVVNSLNTITGEDMTVLKDLLNNTKYEQDYTYSYVSDSLATNDNHLSIVRATEIFRSHFLRNIEGRPWGFIVCKDVMGPGQTYSVSFRAQGGTKDVSVLANKLGGGGHKPAAGAKIEAGSVEEAVSIVQAVILEP